MGRPNMVTYLAFYEYEDLCEEEWKGKMSTRNPKQNDR